MNSLSTKVSLLFSRNLKFARTDEDLNIGIFSAISNRKLNFLKDSLQVDSRRELDLREELRFQEIQFISSSERKSRLAHDLLDEEKRWRTSLEDAELVKSAATSSYVSKLLSLNVDIQRFRRHIESSSYAELDHDATLHNLEQQKMELRFAERQLLAATKEVDAVKEKSQAIVDLVKKFREARDYHYQASSKYQMAKTNWTNISKDIQRTNKLMQSINDSAMSSSFIHMMSTRFWKVVGEMLAINFRQRKYSL